MTSKNFWREQGTFNVPTAPKSVNCPQIFESKKLTQLGQARRFAADSEYFGASPVARLDYGVRPANIAEEISKIVVDTVKFVVGWAFPKVFRKGFKRLLPTLADRNAPCAVMLIFVAVGICASLEHVVISPVGSGLVFPSGLSVDSDSLNVEIAGPTGGRSTTFEACVSYQFFGSAFASAKASSEHSPTCGAVRRAVCDYCELAECSSGEGFSLGHNDGSFIVVSSGGSRLQPILAASVLTSNERGSSAIVLS